MLVHAAFTVTCMCVTDCDCSGARPVKVTPALQGDILHSTASPHMTSGCVLCCADWAALQDLPGPGDALRVHLAGRGGHALLADAIPPVACARPHRGAHGCCACIAFVLISPGSGHHRLLVYVIQSSSYSCSALIGLSCIPELQMRTDGLI